MSSSISIPKQLPLLVVANEVLLPGASMRIPVSSARNMQLVRNHLLSRNSIASTIVGVVPIDAENSNSQGPSRVPTLHCIGTVAVVVQIAGTNWPQPSYNLLVTGLCRFRLEALVQKTPYYVGNVVQIDKFADEDDGARSNAELEELVESFKEIVTRLVGMLDISVPVFAKLKRILDSAPSHGLADICASVVKATYAEKLQVLDAIDVAERFRKTMPLLVRQIEGMQLLQKAKTDLVKPLTASKRGVKDLPHEDDDDACDDIAELENKLKTAKLPDYANRVAMKELSRLKKMAPQMPEHTTTRMYLELMSELPWSKSCEQTLDVNKARKDLDADHYGMEKVKKRVLEYLAVLQLRNSLKGPILCFVGPPGVGKTSIGRSVARTLGREFHRISLGGVCDQSDIRGHRRTYIGAMPGRIIQGLKNAGVKNPVFLLDEIDKLSAGIHGDPAAALLEVLDPEQNCNFTDHYLNLPFDLSQVLFIATANTVSSIPAALLDRMEVINVHGYTQEEKVQIACRHLMPKLLVEHGLSESILHVPEESVKILIAKYTREAGVRSLERKMSGVCRAVAVKVAENKIPDTALNRDEPDKDLPIFPFERPIVIDDMAIEDILGPPLYESEISSRLGQPGVAIGLAWTALGGEIMFVEAACVEGDGQLILTGQLGDVMKESAKLALNWVRNHVGKYDIKMESGSGDLMENKDVHIHFPAGAVGKDGPSAGVTIVTVLVSLFSGRCVRSDVAMTGEITLRGLVLPVGGIKEKVLAAHRAGIRTVILPKRNQKDLHEIPASVHKEMEFIFASHIDDVLQAALEGATCNGQNLMDISFVSKL